MKKSLEFIKLVLISIILYMFTRAYSQEIGNESTDTPLNAGEYHLGWILPDSLNLSISEIAIDDDGILYAFDNKSTLYCMQNNGDILWTYHGDYKYASSLALGKNIIYFFSSDREYYTSNTELCALDKNGKWLWAFKGDMRFFYKPFIAPNGYVYIQACYESFMGGCSNSTGVYRISENGEGTYFNWPDNIKCELQAINSDGLLVVHDYEHGSAMFLSSGCEPLTACKKDEIGQFGSIFYAEGDRFFSPTKKNEIFAFNMNCEILWRYSMGGDRYSIPRDFKYSKEGKIVYTRTLDDRIFAIDFNNGNLIWKIENDPVLKDIGYLVPSAQGALFVVGSRATLSAINGKGKLAWHYKMYNAGDITELLITPKGELLALQNGRLYKFTTDLAQKIAEPEPVPPPADKTEAENEIVSFLFEYITQDKIGILADFIENTEEPENMPDLKPPRENLIIYCTGKKNERRSSYSLDSDKPIKVWTSIGNTFVEQKSQLKAIKDYKNKYVNKDSIIPWGYGIYEFGILSISDDLKEATIGLDFHCGMLCGNGSCMIIERSPSGKWWIVDDLGGWIS